MREILEKKYRGIPLFVILILLSTTILVGATSVWFTINILDERQYTTVTYPDALYLEETTFEVEDVFVPSEILEVTATILGDKEVSGTFRVHVLVTLTDTSYALEAGYNIGFLITENTVQLYKATNLDVGTPTILLDSNNPTYECETGNIQPQVTGTHLIEIAVTNMVWISP